MGVPPHRSFRCGVAVPCALQRMFDSKLTDLAFGNKYFICQNLNHKNATSLMCSFTNRHPFQVLKYSKCYVDVGQLAW